MRFEGCVCFYAMHKPKITTFTISRAMLTLLLSNDTDFCQRDTRLQLYLQLSLTWCEFGVKVNRQIKKLGFIWKFKIR